MEPEYYGQKLALHEEFISRSAGRFMSKTTFVKHKDGNTTAVRVVTLQVVALPTLDSLSRRDNGKMYPIDGSLIADLPEFNLVISEEVEKS
jgi:hypothetical protein